MSSWWTPVSDSLPETDGWYLVTWRCIGDDSRYVENSDFNVGYGFSDRWGSNSDPIAWMALPEPYGGKP